MTMSFEEMLRTKQNEMEQSAREEREREESAITANDEEAVMQGGYSPGGGKDIPPAPDADKSAPYDTRPCPPETPRYDDGAPEEDLRRHEQPMYQQPAYQQPDDEPAQKQGYAQSAPAEWQYGQLHMQQEADAQDDMRQNREQRHSAQSESLTRSHEQPQGAPSDPGTLDAAPDTLAAVSAGSDTSREVQQTSGPPTAVAAEKKKRKRHHKKHRTDSENIKTGLEGVRDLSAEDEAIDTARPAAEEGARPETPRHDDGAPEGDLRRHEQPYEKQQPAGRQEEDAVPETNERKGAGAQMPKRQTDEQVQQAAKEPAGYPGPHPEATDPDALCDIASACDTAPGDPEHERHDDACDTAQPDPGEYPYERAENATWEEPVDIGSVNADKAHNGTDGVWEPIDEALDDDVVLTDDTVDTDCVPPEECGIREETGNEPLPEPGPLPHDVPEDGRRDVPADEKTEEPWSDDEEGIENDRQAPGIPYAHHAHEDLTYRLALMALRNENTQDADEVAKADAISLLTGAVRALGGDLTKRDSFIDLQNLVIQENEKYIQTQRELLGVMDKAVAMRRSSDRALESYEQIRGKIRF